MPNKHTQSNKTRKRKGKDLDQITEDLRPEKSAKLANQEVDLDLPGNAQFYCIECNRYFVDDSTISKHKNTKVHKRRVRALESVPYTHKEAQAAAGKAIYDRGMLVKQNKLSKKKAIFDSGIVA